jgi:hypothetical protein
MRVTVTAQRCAHGAGRRTFPVVKQSCEVIRLLPRDRLNDDLGRSRANPGKRLKITLLHQPDKLAIGQPADNPGSPPESADAVGRSPGTLQLEGDLPQCPSRFHVTLIQVQAMLWPS